MWQVLAHPDKVKSLPPQHRFCASVVLCISHPALSLQCFSSPSENGSAHQILAFMPLSTKLQCCIFYENKMVLSWLHTSDMNRAVHIPGDYYCLPLLTHHMQKGREKTTDCIYTLNNHRKQINTQAIRVKKNLNIITVRTLEVLYICACLMSYDTCSYLCSFSHQWMHSMQRMATLVPAQKQEWAGNPQRLASPPAQRQV